MCGSDCVCVCVSDRGGQVVRWHGAAAAADVQVSWLVTLESSSLVQRSTIVQFASSVTCLYFLTPPADNTKQTHTEINTSDTDVGSHFTLLSCFSSPFWPLSHEWIVTKYYTHYTKTLHKNRYNVCKLSQRRGKLTTCIKAMPASLNH